MTSIGKEKRRNSIAALFVATLFLASCATDSIEEGEVHAVHTLTKGDVTLTLEDFSEVPEIAPRDWELAFTAFKTSCTKTKDAELFHAVCSKATESAAPEAEQFFKENFDLWRVTTSAKDGSTLETGLMTGYYEPALKGSRHKTKRYKVPLLGVPHDLVTTKVIGKNSRYADLKQRLKNGVLQAYDTREEIMKRRDLERHALCWVEDPVEAFFLQIQGSGRILFDDGTSMRLGFADTNGHPYRAIGQWLIKETGIPASQMSMERIKSWAKDNPNRVNEMLSYNKRYVFFSERVVTSEEEGPIGSLGVPLTSEASVAIDKNYWTLGLPFIVSATQANPPLNFTRPVIAQDTGGAIRGALRFDFFWGYGQEASRKAGSQKSSVSAWVLFPKEKLPWEEN